MFLSLTHPPPFSYMLCQKVIPIHIKPLCILILPHRSFILGSVPRMCQFNKAQKVTTKWERQKKNSSCYISLYERKSVGECERERESKQEYYVNGKICLWNLSHVWVCVWVSGISVPSIRFILFFFCFPKVSHSFIPCMPKNFCYNTHAHIKYIRKIHSNSISLHLLTHLGEVLLLFYMYDLVVVGNRWCTFVNVMNMLNIEFLNGYHDFAKHHHMQHTLKWLAPKSDWKCFSNNWELFWENERERENVFNWIAKNLVVRIPHTRINVYTSLHVMYLYWKCMTSSRLVFLEANLSFIVVPQA